MPLAPPVMTASFLDGMGGVSSWALVDATLARMLDGRQRCEGDEEEIHHARKKHARTYPRDSGRPHTGVIPLHPRVVALERRLTARAGCGPPVQYALHGNGAPHTSQG